MWEVTPCDLLAEAAGPPLVKSQTPRTLNPPTSPRHTAGPPCCLTTAQVTRDYCVLVGQLCVSSGVNIPLCEDQSKGALSHRPQIKCEISARQCTRMWQCQRVGILLSCPPFVAFSAETWTCAHPEIDWFLLCVNKAVFFFFCNGLVQNHSSAWIIFFACSGGEICHHYEQQNKELQYPLKRKE